MGDPTVTIRARGLGEVIDKLNVEMAEISSLAGSMVKMKSADDRAERFFMIAEAICRSTEAVTQTLADALVDDGDGLDSEGG